MSISDGIALLGGIALFLFGMSLMGDGLKRVAGNKLELILYQLSSTPIRGILLGTGVTAVIQSSSATSVMVVGFVNSGMMKVRQAIGIVLGAILGTSVTGWIICLSDLSGGSGWVQLLSTATLTGIIAVIGIILRMFTKGQSTRHMGDILLGFAVLMYGMSAMSGAVSPLRESEAFIQVLTSFSNPLLGILVGLVFTSVLQSASAAIGILQALSVTGAISFGVALPIVMGIAIGAARAGAAVGAGGEHERQAHGVCVSADRHTGRCDLGRHFLRRERGDAFYVPRHDDDDREHRADEHALPSGDGDCARTDDRPAGEDCVHAVPGARRDAGGAGYGPPRGTLSAAPGARH